MAELIVQEKTCPRCRVTQHRSEFHHCAGRLDGLFTYCKTCARARYYGEHPARYKIADPLDAEEWRAVVGAENVYSVSNFGRVRRDSTNRLLKPSTVLVGKGYLAVNIRIGGKRIPGLVHRLVARAFLDPDKREMGVNHKDGDTLNNHLHNLEFTTQQENVQHARRILDVFPHKLSDAQVRAARSRARKGETHSSIASDYMVAQSTISRAVGRLTHSHID